MDLGRYVGNVVVASFISAGLVIPSYTIWLGTINFPKEIRRLNTKRNQLMEVLYNHADTNNDSQVSFPEQVDAWRRMGFDGPFVESFGDRSFPTPTLQALEKGIASYETQE